jgi:hypothetical protein
MTTMEAPLTCEFMVISQSSNRVDIDSYRNVICSDMSAPKCAHARQVSLVGDTQERLTGEMNAA